MPSGWEPSRWESTFAAKDLQVKTRKAVLHIGPPKSGSKAIQAFCNANPPVLESNGVLYPRGAWHGQLGSCFSSDPLNYVFNAHTNRTDSKEIAVGDAAYLEDVSREVRNAQQQTVIFPYEGFFSIDKAMIERIHEFLRGISDLQQVIFFCRAPVSFARSALSQRLRMGLSAGLEEGDELPILAFEDAITPFVEVFSRRNVLARHFDGSELKNADVVDDFFATIGHPAIERQSAPVRGHRENESISAEAAMLAVEIAKRSPPPFPGNRFFTRYNRLLSGIRGAKIALTSEQQSRVLSASQRHTEYLQREFGIVFERENEEVKAEQDLFGDEFLSSLASQLHGMIAESERDRADRQSAERCLTTRVKALEDELHAVYASKSWKITGALRSLRPAIIERGHRLGRILSKVRRKGEAAEPDAPIGALNESCNHSNRGSRMHHLFSALKTKNRLDSEGVNRAYQLLFEREPESADVVSMHVDGHADVWSLLASLMDSDEFRCRTGQRHNLRTTLDALEILHRYERAGLRHRPGFITNFLGIQTDVSFLGHLKGSEGYVAGLPVPGDFHSSVSEWIAGLRGVDLSGDEFVVVELGAGWGPWMADLCRAAAIKGARRTFAIGCEADELHCKFIFEHLANNGFVADDYKVYQGAIGPRKGITLFPISLDSTNDWGMRPIFCATEQEADAVTAHDHADYRGHSFERFHRVPCYTLEEVFAGVGHVDVLHIDIQGDEFALLRESPDLLKRMVRYLVIGTHGRQVEGELIALLGGAGWKLEVEEPCFFDINTPNFSPQVDGTQGWRNLAFGS